MAWDSINTISAPYLEKHGSTLSVSWLETSTSYLQWICSGTLRYSRRNVRGRRPVCCLSLLCCWSRKTLVALASPWREGRVEEGRNWISFCCVEKHGDTNLMLKVGDISTVMLPWYCWLFFIIACFKNMKLLFRYHLLKWNFMLVCSFLLKAAQDAVKIK